MPLNDGLKGYLIGGRTNIAGTAVNPDVDQEELRMLPHFLYGGRLVNMLDASANPTAFQVKQDTGSNMVVRVGSTQPKRDGIVLRGTIAGQGVYIARIDDPNGYVAVTVPTTDATFPAKYSVFAYVNDAAYGGDAARATFGIACLRGTPAASPVAPNPLTTWGASARLATFQLAANATAVTNAILTAGTVDLGQSQIMRDYIPVDPFQFDYSGFFGTIGLKAGGFPMASIADGTLPATKLVPASPRGMMAQAVQSGSVSVSGTGSSVDVPGLSYSFTAISTRYYKTTCLLLPYCDNNGGYGQAFIADAGGSAKGAIGIYPHPAGSGIVGGTEFFVIETGLSGTITRKAQIYKQGAAGTWSAYGTGALVGRMVTEDIGGV